MISSNIWNQNKSNILYVMDTRNGNTYNFKYNIKSFSYEAQETDGRLLQANELYNYWKLISISSTLKNILPLP